MTTDFVTMLNEEIDECTDLESMFATSVLIHNMKSFSGVREYSVPRWKDKIRRLIPTWKDASVFAVDLNSIFHAAFSVQPGDAENLCLQMLRNIYKDLGKPELFVVAVDCRKGVAKKCTHPQYKHKREEKPAEYYEQLSATVDTLSARLRLEEHFGVEADDCLATIAFQASLLGAKCVLIANDKDLWQSLYSGVAMYCRKTNEYRNAEWLMAHHRIKPTQVVDWLCMVGKNDMPGVQGVGDKTASDWLQAYGDFINAMDATKNEHMRAFFKEHYWKVKEAHTLSTSVPVRWFCGLDANK